ncbi:hypothetical protein V8E53_006330 [Lactarius tabidus]
MWKTVPFILLTTTAFVISARCFLSDTCVGIPPVTPYTTAYQPQRGQESCSFEQRQQQQDERPRSMSMEAMTQISLAAGATDGTALPVGTIATSYPLLRLPQDAATVVVYA